MRSPEQVRWDFVQEWLHKAETDLRSAKLLLKLEGTDHFPTAFHAQQAAEKFLKALLVRHQILFPKSHDISQLLRLASATDPTVEKLLASASTLTPYGVEFRYPGDQTADLTTAQSAVGEAIKVREVVLNLLKGYLNQGRPLDDVTG